MDGRDEIKSYGQKGQSDEAEDYFRKGISLFVIHAQDYNAFQPPRLLPK